jgi:hypothetical protein
MTGSLMVLLTLFPLDVLAYQPTPSPSPIHPSRGPGRGAYIIGGFMGLGILLLAMTLLGMRPKREGDRAPDQ